MKHTTRRKPSVHGKKNYKHLAAAFAGAVMLSAAMLPGIPMATVHAAVNPNVNSSQRTSKTNRPEDNQLLQSSVTNKLTGASQSNVNVRQTGKSTDPTAAKQPSASQPKANKDQSNNQVKSHHDANKAPSTKATTSDATKPSADKPSADKPPTDFKQVVEATATAYAPGAKDNDQWGSKTYTGTNIRPGVIAVDPSVIPLGSRVYLQYPDGHGAYAVAEDTGGAIKGSRIDVAKTTENEASDFGIQKVKVYVINSPSKTKDQSHSNS